MRKFRELGFKIFTEFIPYLSEKCFDNFIDNFIDEIEKNKLLDGGADNGGSWKGFITSKINYAFPIAKT